MACITGGQPAHFTQSILMARFTSAFASLELLRQPEQPNEPLQAFDAADEYLLNHLHSQPLTADSRVLLLNDSFGALACSLAGRCTLTSSGDSHLGFIALQNNLARNDLAPDSVTFVPASAAVEGPFDLVLIRVPKTLALLEEHQLDLHSDCPLSLVQLALWYWHQPLV